MQVNESSLLQVENGEVAGGCEQNEQPRKFLNTEQTAEGKCRNLQDSLPRQ
jgi:hypothetical protein